ncbi:heme NO-binding domain-containing protein [Plastorhodobacter daqingensis]|uniref:Heme NO-binding domain-containing protein n=1 Tax=Plastorhodobacter daqingensis TaxID=1387281 RepID=A0ABW2UHZ5_9RHOB
MHGLINRTIQYFVQDIHGPDVWGDMARRLKLPEAGYDPSLAYDDAETFALIDVAVARLHCPRHAFLHDLGQYLITSPAADPLRRLLRVGGATFIEALHALDRMPARAALALPDCALPPTVLTQQGPGRLRLVGRTARADYAHVLMGLIRALAAQHDVGVDLDHARHGEIITIDVVVAEAEVPPRRPDDAGVAYGRVLAGTRGAGQALAGASLIRAGGGQATGATV